METRFAFGKNWIDYLDKSLTTERIDIAVQAMKDLLGVETLRGETFLDIGSGSGLHSLAAYRLGADEIISFDYDADAVRATERLRKSVGNPANWQVFQGSILDKELAAKYRASIVYSWGVLHHTGDMWQAICNAASMVVPGGIMCIAIYNQVDRWFAGSEMWRKIKRAYVNGPDWRKRLIIGGYKAYYFLHKAVRERKNPITEIRTYNDRGMEWHINIVDWVGGYPFEFASVAEVVAFCKTMFNHETIKVVPRPGHACNEFVFRAR